MTLSFCRKIKFVLIGLLLLVCVSCKTTQQTTITKKETTEWPQELNFSFLSSKVSVEYENYTLQGQIRIKKDSIIWISLSKFGLELARIKATTDSVFFLNKMQSEYSLGNYQDLGRTIGFDINFNILQSILLGNDFYCFNKKNVKKQKVNNTVTFQFENRQVEDSCKNAFTNSLQQVFYVDTEVDKITENHIKLVGRGEELHAQYSKFIVVNNQQIASFLQLSTAGNNKMAISIEYSNVNFGSTLSFPFNVPAKYKTGTF